MAGADLVVQATPVGMTTGDVSSGALAFDPGLLHAGQTIVDLVYHPLETPLLKAAAARGAQVVTGIGMLVHQAALALEQWTGRPVPVEAMWAAVDEQLRG